MLMIECYLILHMYFLISNYFSQMLYICACNENQTKLPISILRHVYQFFNQNAHQHLVQFCFITTFPFYPFKSLSVSAWLNFYVLPLL